jgi:hypothetical protein
VVRVDVAATARNQAVTSRSEAAGVGRWARLRRQWQGNDRRSADTTHHAGCALRARAVDVPIVPAANATLICKR